MKYLSVTKAEYAGGCRVAVHFTDMENRIVDFAVFFQSHDHPQYNIYKDARQFQSFQVEHGNLVWGENRDLIFPVADLYHGKIY